MKLEMWNANYSLLKQIATRYGTPVYVYNASIISQKITVLNKAFQSLPFQLHYAMKANENPVILNFLLQNNLGVDTVSTYEIKRALQVGFKPDSIVYTPSCPSEEELDFAFQNQVMVHIPAIEYLEYILQNYPDKPVGLRINPANQIGGNQKISTAHADSKFGIPLSRLEEILNFVKKGLKINALHIHTGSDVKIWQDLARSVDVIFDVARRFPDLKYIDLGSGLKVKYAPDDNEIDLPAYASYIQKKLNNFPYPVQIKFEPGKYLISESGVFLVRTNVVKQGYFKQFVGVNSGFHHLIRPMYYDAYHEIVNISNPVAPKQKYDIVGQLCEEDTIAYDREITTVRKGDLLMIKNAGAYGFSMAMQYNLRPLPQQVWIDLDKNFELI